MLHDGSDLKLRSRTDFNIRRSSPRDHATESVVGNEPHSRLAGLGFGVFGPRNGDDITNSCIAGAWLMPACGNGGSIFEFTNLETTVSDRSLGSCTSH